MKSKYLFTSERLGFRTWSLDDTDQFAKMNADAQVMEYFPKTLSREESLDFIDRLQKHFSKYQHCYFAAEIKETAEFIGFIGLAYQIYDSEFTPAVDIGWRLKTSAWGNGYATEGAKRCLDYAFNTLQYDAVIATCTAQNNKSERVMQKIGMTKIGEFMHPNLKHYPEYEKCVCFSLEKA